MEKPIISIIATAARPQLWEQFYKEVTDGNITPFEIVFVGPNRPNFALPENFRYIYSEAKPVQCLEMACRNAKGEFVLVAADDEQFPTGVIDVLYGYMLRMWNEKAVIMSRFSDNIDHGPMDNLLVLEPYPEFPIVAPVILIRKSVWQELGGLDRGFNLIFSTDDLQLRIFEAGGHPFILPPEEFTVKEKPHVYPRLVTKYMLDRILLDSLWKEEGIFSKKRLDFVQSFSEDEIFIDS